MVNREDRVLAGPEKAPSTASLTLHRKRSACDHSLPPQVGPTEPHNCVSLKLLLPEENPLANPVPEATRPGDGFSLRVQGHLAMWSRARVMMVMRVSGEQPGVTCGQLTAGKGLAVGRLRGLRQLGKTLSKAEDKPVFSRRFSS